MTEKKHTVQPKRDGEIEDGEAYVLVPRKLVESAAMFLDIGSRQVPDESMDVEMQKGDRLKTRPLSDVMKSVAAKLRATPLATQHGGGLRDEIARIISPNARWDLPPKSDPFDMKREAFEQVDKVLTAIRAIATTPPAPSPDREGKDILADALLKLGLMDMSLKARGGYYHDFLSPLPMPEMQLVNDLAGAANRMPANRREILALRAAVINGEHDANVEESEAWARSPEGIAAMNMLSDETIKRKKEQEK